MIKAKFFFVLIFVVFLGFISGCSLVKNDSESGISNELEQKNAVITITGILSKNGELFFVTDSTGVIHDVESYAVSFDQYVGKTVTVSGQYSGDTLYVTEISEQ